MRPQSDSLIECDAVLVYCGHGSDKWFRMMQLELKKVAGYARKQPLTIKAVYLGPPATMWKEKFRSRDMLVIKNFENFSPDTLSPLLAMLQTPSNA